MNYLNKEIISSSATDAKINLSLIGAANLIQDNICEFFEELNIDQTIMKQKYNCVWVFIKNKLEIYKDVKWNEEVQVECFISNKTAVRMVVDTILRNKQNEIVLYSKVEICFLDLNTNKIRLLTEDLFPVKFEVKPSLKDFKFEKFMDLVAENKIGEVKINSTNIDYCHHTNNIEYIRFILGTYSLNEVLNNRIKGFEIHYLNQTYENDNLSVFKTKNNGVDNFKIISNNKDIIKCTVKTEQI